MGSDKELEEYERDYLKRLEEAKISSDKDYAEKSEKESQIVNELLATLSAKDYFMLESMKKDDNFAMLKFGTIETMDIIEKLYRCKLIKKLDRKLTFTEKEKLEKFKDSVAYKQQEARLKRIMDDELIERTREYMKKMDMESPDEFCEATEFGKQTLEKKREELKPKWEELQSLYDNKETQQFREVVEREKNSLLLFGIMGFTNGALLATMMSDMQVNSQIYMQDFSMIESQNFAQNMSEGANFDGGDFEGGGFEVGF